MLAENTDIDLAYFQKDQYISSSLVRQGYFPCSPLLHKSVISTRTLELYHHLFVRCPRLSIQPFVRALCDLHGIRFRNHLCVQFSEAYDAFRAVKTSILSSIKTVLGRDNPDWRSLNACPACQYPTAGESELEFEMLAAMDGNDSLKRVERREASGDASTPGRVKERYDPRVGGRDYFLDPKEVDEWDIKNWRNQEGWKEPAPQLSKTGAEKGCEDRWENMKKSHTEADRGIFDETGIFVATCRHMFVLWALDMIKSGEQRKYALAFLHRFLSAIKEERANLGLRSPGKKAFGYDIGCQLQTTLDTSPLQPLAEEENARMVTGSLHGHAHNRLCQLKFLLSYINGCGLEDLEVLERLFSLSNALAMAIRHASKFHRRQMISSWFYHHDNFEAYANLSKFIYNNYRQALTILEAKDSVISRMRAIGVLDGKEIFGWLDEEKEYLESRREEPEEDLNRMDLYVKQVKLNECRARLEAAHSAFIAYNPSDYPANVKRTNAVEQTMQHEQEKEEKLMSEVHFLERRLELKEPWTEDSEEWKKAEEMFKNHSYRKAVNRLEGLIVARIFELSKMHMAGTGMRQHLGKALKTRSKAIQEAVRTYNTAAAKLSLPREALSYDEVVEKAYVSELDFLKDTDSNIHEKIWAVPANRVLMTEYFKLFRASEELDRLHVEIHRLLTYMKEEQEYLRAVELNISENNPQLAYQVSLYRWERGRFNDLHRLRLRNIISLPGFDATNRRFFRAGVGLKCQSQGEDERADDNMGEEMDVDRVNGEDDSDSEGEEGDIQAEAQVTAILGVAVD
ncbi:hypothetical protein DFH05DRAFT_1400357 [Lentinula detonsa]|uniref:CxC1-like cysteine cluster associated with KDZ transposases domain-containing protein n=1 Tax=Lentinula detonsa TaxID=2804962 RepID=A0A9W8TWU3_9AGAR|nr:hypothetical protein DFH05DRAFT_1400357 [Lentinula detonsa]